MATDVNLEAFAGVVPPEGGKGNENPLQKKETPPVDPKTNPPANEEEEGYEPLWPDDDDEGQEGEGKGGEGNPDLAGKDPKKKEDGDPGNGEGGYAEFAESLGLKIKDDTIEGLAGAIVELKQRAEAASAGSVHPDLLPIQKRLEAGEKFSDIVRSFTASPLAGVLSMTPEQKIRWHYEQEGYTKDEIEETVDELRKTNMVSLKAKEIDKSVQKKLKREADEQAAKSVQQKTEEEESIRKAQKMLKEGLSKTDKIFGFKLAKDPERAKQIKDQLYKDITNPAFWNFQSVEEAVEIAYFRRFKEKIIKSLLGKGRESGVEYIKNGMKPIVPTDSKNGKKGDGPKSSAGQEVDYGKFATLPSPDKKTK